MCPPPTVHSLLTKTACWVLDAMAIDEREREIDRWTKTVEALIWEMHAWIALSIGPHARTWIYSIRALYPLIFIYVQQLMIYFLNFVMYCLEFLGLICLSFWIEHVGFHPFTIGKTSWQSETVEQAVGNHLNHLILRLLNRSIINHFNLFTSTKSTSIQISGFEYFLYLCDIFCLLIFRETLVL